MSQERLAEHLGITFQQAQKYESGANRMAANRLFAISAAIHTSVAQLFEGLERVHPFEFVQVGSNPIGDALATPEGVELAYLFSMLRGSRTRRQVVQ